MAVVTPLNNFLGPEGDTVTADKHYSILNTQYFNGKPEDYEGVTCQLQCPPSLSNDVDAQTFAQTHLTVCIRHQEDLETTECNEKIFFTRFCFCKNNKRTIDR